MIDWIESLDAHWFWLSAGVILAIGEIIVPGFFMMWFAIAAIATGLLALFLPIAMTVQILLFALFSVIAVYAGRRWLVLNPIESADPNLNNRVARLIGETVIVVEAIENGRGRVKVGDSVWIARGEDQPIGARVRIVGGSGSELNVEQA